MGEQNGRLELSTGVVLEVVDVSMAALGAVKSKMYTKRPQAPQVYVEAIEQNEANPDDPDYLAAVEEWEEQTGTKMLDAAVILGTKVFALPEGFPGPDAEEWATPLVKLGITIPGNKESDDRYMAWVRYRAAPTAEDIASILLATSRKAGVTEEDAAEAAASFRRNSKR